MKKLEIQEITSSYVNFENFIDKEIKLRGMIQNLRVLAWGGFLILRTPNYIIQTVFDKKNENIAIDDLVVETTIDLKGIVKATKIKDKAIYPNNYELQITEITIISTPHTTPLPVDIAKKELDMNLDTKLDFRPITLRHPKQRAIFKISNVIYSEFGNYLSSIGFTQIISPKIVFAGAEGGANVFEIDYFGRKAYLAQSPQFYKQMMVGVYGKVYEQGTVFRAEKHNTSRHLNEYVSLDYEMMLETGFEDLIQVETNMLKHVFNKLKELCPVEIALLEIDVPTVDNVAIMEFDEVHEIIFDKFQKDYRGDNDLAPEEEKLICQYAEKELGAQFVFVTHYPSDKRPFYTMDDPTNPKKTLSFDLLFKGIEITTGGQRLHKYDDYIVKMKKLGLVPEDFESYLQCFKYGMPPHGGLAIGLERLTAQLIGLSNVKEASLFPRDISRLEP